jgi:arginine decarboxylase
MYNIMTYSSILPKIANRVERPAKNTHGAVMETIMAVANAPRGKMATAGIIYGWLYNKITGEKYGGLVCEYNGNLPESDANSQLKQSLNELYTNGYSDVYEMRDIMLISDSFVPKKAFGTTIVSLCFTSYLFPIIEQR